MKELNTDTYDNSLTRLSLSGNTEIEDGDLSPAENIEDVFIVPRKHYTITVNSEKYAAIQKTNLEKLKKGLQ